jgi:hypothetical protein
LSISFFTPLALDIRGDYVAILDITFDRYKSPELQPQLLNDLVNIAIGNLFLTHFELDVFIVARSNFRLEGHGGLEYYRVYLDKLDLGLRYGRDGFLYQSFLVGLGHQVLQRFLKDSLFPHVLFHSELGLAFLKLGRVLFWLMFEG